MLKMMLVTCSKRELQTIVEEYGDWDDEGLTVQLYGLTEKAENGFIFMEWSKPIPEQFYTTLKEDGDIIDYVVYDAISLATPMFSERNGNFDPFF